MKDKELFEQITAYVCIGTEEGCEEHCPHGYFPDCRQYGFFCYRVLRETQCRFDVLEEVRKIVKEDGT